MTVPNIVEAAESMKTDHVGNHWQRFQDAESADSGDRQRGLSNLRLYLPTTAWDVYPGNVTKQFREQGRQPQKYNFITMNTDAQAGNIIAANSVDPKFVDSEADSIDTTETLQSLQKAYYCDKNMFNYDQSRDAAVLNGCIYRGVEEIKIIRTIDEPLGRIGYDSLSPTSIIFDPTAVMTDDLADEARESWKRFYLYPGEIMREFPQAADAVKGYMYRMSNFSESRSFVDVPEELYWQNQYMVVEWYHIKTEMMEIAFDMENMVELPNDDKYTFGSAEDFQFKKEYSERNGRRLNPGAITVRKKYVEALYVTTFAPSLNIVLQTKKDERQIYKADGKIRLPFYVWAYTQKNGKTSGVIDILRDPQEDINKREAARTKYMTQTPFNKPIIHPLAWGDDMRKMENIKKNLNDPAEPLFLDEDAPPGVPLVTNFNGVAMNPALLQDEQWKIQLMEKMSGLNPAMQGVTERSGESGIHFGRKVVEGNTLARVRSSNFRSYEKAKAEGWFQLAKKLYGGSNEDERIVNRNRTFVDENGDKTVLNKVEGHDAFGEPIMINDLSKIKRGYVIITQTKENDYKKQADREINIALSQALGPTTPQNMGYKAVLDADLVKSIDDLTPDQKEEIEEMSDLSVSVAKKQLQLQSSQLDMQLAQVQGMGQPQMPGMAPQDTQVGGIPPELTAQPTQGSAQVAA